MASFRDALPGGDPESRDSGFDASHRPGMTGSPGDGPFWQPAYPHHILHKYRACTASAWPFRPDVVSRQHASDRHPGPTAMPVTGCGGGDISLMSSSSSSANASNIKTVSAPDSFFTATLTEADPDIAAAIRGELGRQRHEIELIASENIVSRAVLEAQGSVMTN